LPPDRLNGIPWLNGSRTLSKVSNSSWAFQVGENELGLYDLNIPDRVRLPDHMDDLGIFEQPDHMDYRIHRPYVAQKGVAEALSLTRTLHQTCHVQELERSRCKLLGLQPLSQQRQPPVRDSHPAPVRLHRTEWIIRGLCASSC
jgi:hypothetical protein